MKTAPKHTSFLAAARSLGLSRGRLRRIVELAGIKCGTDGLWDRGALAEAVMKYSGEASDKLKDQILQRRARLLSAQCERAELTLSRERAELVSRDAVEATLEAIGGIWSSTLTRELHAAAPVLVGLEIGALREELDKVRNKISAGINGALGEAFADATKETRKIDDDEKDDT